MARLPMGKIPLPNIGANGNWYIGERDTGISAQGKSGDQVKNCVILQNSSYRVYKDNVRIYKEGVTFKFLANWSGTDYEEVGFFFPYYELFPGIVEGTNINGVFGLVSIRERNNDVSNISYADIVWTWNGTSQTTTVNITDVYEHITNCVVTQPRMEIEDVEAYSQVYTETMDEVQHAEHANTANVADKANRTLSVDLKYTHDIVGVPIRNQGLFQIVVNASIGGAGDTIMIPFTVFVPHHWDGSRLGSNIIAVTNKLGQWFRCFIVLEDYDVAFMRYYIELSETSETIQKGNFEIVSISSIPLNYQL